MLPRKALNALKTKLGQIENEIKELNMAYRMNGLSRAEMETRVKRRRRKLELAIREAFLRFMASVLANYKSYQLTVTRRPDLKAIDRNLTKFFDCEGFVRSKEAQCQFFYSELTKTQLFYDCIMNLSFTSELEPSLADAFYFFTEICGRLGAATSTASSHLQPASPHQHNAQWLQPASPTTEHDIMRLLELYEPENSQTVVVLPPFVKNTRKYYEAI